VRQPRGCHSHRAKDAARAGFIDLLSKHDFGDTAMWVRVNALNSPWILDDLEQIIDMSATNSM
jgi:citrate lyase beta subunit